jgi:hypothetical protein
MKELMIVSPTARLARYCWSTFTFKEKYSPLTKKTNGRSLAVELINGDRIHFAYRAQGEMVLRGFRGEIEYIDWFEDFERIMDKKIRNDGIMATIESESYLNKKIDEAAESIKKDFIKAMRAEITKLQTYKMFPYEDTVYVERDKVMKIFEKYTEGESKEWQ